VNLKDFLVWQSGKCFFDFKDISSRVNSLGIRQERRQSVFTPEYVYFLVFL